MKKIQISRIVAIMVMAFTISSSCTNKNNFSKAEKEIINQNPESLLNIFTVDNEKEAPILFKKSIDIAESEIQSEQFKLLTRRMLEIVTNPEDTGVGLAAPQIGINKRIMLLQRFDKEGEPFEFYANIYVVELSEEKQYGEEGCYSIPNKSAEVERAKWVKVSYINPITLESIEETVLGFTAVIFQHEIDHLDGILFTDRIK